MKGLSEYTPDRNQPQWFRTMCGTLISLNINPVFKLNEKFMKGKLLKKLNWKTQKQNLFVNGHLR